MFVFGLLIVSAVYVFGILANGKSRESLTRGYRGIVPFVGWSLIFLGTLLQIVDGISG